MIPVGSFLAFSSADLKRDLRHMIERFHELDGAWPRVLLCPADQVAAVEAVIGHEWPLAVHAFKMPARNYWLGHAPPFACAVPPAVQEAALRVLETAAGAGQQLTMGLFDEG